MSVHSIAWRALATCVVLCLAAVATYQANKEEKKPSEQIKDLALAVFTMGLVVGIASILTIIWTWMSAGTPPVNMEQLEAEVLNGYRVACNLDVSLTTLYLLTNLALQAARQENMQGPAVIDLLEFAADARRKAQFPAQMAIALEHYAKPS